MLLGLNIGRWLNKGSDMAITQFYKPESNGIYEVLAEEFGAWFAVFCNGEWGYHADTPTGAYMVWRELGANGADQNKGWVRMVSDLQGLDISPKTESKASDMVNSPPHYTAGGIECIDAIEAALTPEEFRGYLKGQIFKYNWRLGLKDEPVQEAGKLSWYADRLKAFLAKCASKV